MAKYYQEFFNMFKPETDLSLNLFNSEGFYWLTTATAVAFAVEELVDFKAKFPELFVGDIEVQAQKSNPLVEMFKQSVKSGETSSKVQDIAKQATLDNLKLLADFSKKSFVFTPRAGVVMGKTYATYWLIYKLIEVEWQQILDSQETQETYLLLDTVIMDHQELEQLEEQCLEKQSLTADDKVYLKSHWERVKNLWPNLYQDLYLLAGGWISFKPPYKP